MVLLSEECYYYSVTDRQWCVMSKPEDQFCVINVLFDTGNQQTFKSDRLAKELKLASLRQIDMEVSVFSKYRRTQYEISRIWNSYQICM